MKSIEEIQKSLTKNQKRILRVVNDGIATPKQIQFVLENRYNHKISYNTVLNNLFKLKKIDLVELQIKENRKYKYWFYPGFRLKEIKL